VPGFGTVDIVEQKDAGDRFWDLFGASGECLNEGNPFWRKPTRSEVEEFLAQKLKEVLTRLETECEQSHIDQEHLDEAIYEAAQMNNAGLNQAAEAPQQERLISTAEERAARINNGGRRSQLACLFEMYGERGAVELLQQLRT
jgi:hypothetical protein